MLLGVDLPWGSRAACDQFRVTPEPLQQTPLPFSPGFPGEKVKCQGGTSLDMKRYRGTSLMRTHLSLGP